MPPTNEPAGTGAAGTEGTPPAATQQPQTPPTATPQLPQLPDGYEAIRTEDKNNLISQRDKANNSSQETEMVVSALAQKDAIRDAMATSDFKDKYPDVTEADLVDANPLSDEQILAIAEAKQQRYEVVKQSALQKVQIAEAPTISQADKDTKMKELAQPAKSSRFQQALQLARTQVK
jgi:hypothetical protein